ncbi:MAG: hypothetical protein U9N83_14645 [Thermodesulfobacteriota bacterium]|nr:hypothetical protein [Thermodesulfobacteriota bacterium]
MFSSKISPALNRRDERQKHAFLFWLRREIDEKYFPSLMSLMFPEVPNDLVVKKGTGLKLSVYSLSGTRIDRRSVFGI